MFVSTAVLNVLTDWIAALAKLHRSKKALQYGDFHDVMITNQQCAFERQYDGEKIWTIVNAADESYHFHAPNGIEKGYDLLNQQEIMLNDFMMPPLSAYIIKI